MLTTLRRQLIRLIGVALVFAMVPVQVAKADIASCTIDTDVHLVGLNSVPQINFVTTNSESNDIKWIRVIVPGAEFQIMSTSVTGWSEATSGGSTSTYLTGGTLAPGDTLEFSIVTSTPGSPTAPADWQVYMSDDPGGANAVACGGSKDLMADGPVSVPLVISDIRIVGVGTTGVTVQWETNRPSTGQVQYGQDETYGQQTPQNMDLVTSHSIALGGLTPATAYHFIVLSYSPPDDGVLGSADNTFVTADLGVVVQEVGEDPPAGISNVPGVVILDQPTETVAPVVLLGDIPSRPYPNAPVVLGEATDNVAVARIEYSSDGGANWLPVDSIAFVATKKVAGSAAHVKFSFTPSVTDDGTYKVIVRATDSSNNVGASDAKSFVLDRLPPRFGPVITTIGSQNLLPRSDGLLVVSEGVDFRITTKMVGGPETAVLRARGVKVKTNQAYALTQNSQSGLWSGVMSFAKAGRYVLSGEARDGAGNVAERKLGEIEVVPALTLKQDGKAEAGAKISLYVRGETEQTWGLWDGTGYGMENPQTTDKAGKVTMLVPRGTYYVTAKPVRGQEIVSRIFSVSDPTPLSGVLATSGLAKADVFGLKIPLPWSALAEPPLPRAAGAGDIAAVSVPLVSLAGTDGAVHPVADWYGRPTVIGTVASWASASNEQLAPLEELAKNPDIQVLALGQAERAETLRAFLAMSGSRIQGVADADAVLGSTFGVIGVPVVYIVNRHGVVKSVMVGSHTVAEIIDQLATIE